MKESAIAVAEESMIRATEEAVQFNDGHKRDLEVAYDGTWQKRGFKSKNGVCSLTSLDTGKVLDVEVLTKFCSGCVKRGGSAVKKDLHNPNCVKDYEGVSGGMETIAAVSIFRRSLEKRKVRYEYILGDGDSKAYQAVLECNPYPDLEIKKLECIAHV